MTAAAWPASDQHHTTPSLQRSDNMTTTEIANKLADLCRQGKSGQALALYAPDAISVEAAMPPGMDCVSRGVAAIKGKGQWWEDNPVIHSVDVAGPGRMTTSSSLASRWT